MLLASHVGLMDQVASWRLCDLVGTMLLPLCHFLQTKSHVPLTSLETWTLCDPQHRTVGHNTLFEISHLDLIVAAEDHAFEETSLPIRALATLLQVPDFGEVHWCVSGLPEPVGLWRQWLLGVDGFAVANNVFL